MIRRPPISPPSPTRRSSDLQAHSASSSGASHTIALTDFIHDPCSLSQLPRYAHFRATRPPRAQPPARSEEHTSELQSQSNIVCRLLLEKKTAEHTRRQTPHD